MKDEDLIVLCKEAIDRLEDESLPDISIVLEDLHTIRAALVNRGESINA